MSKKLKNIVTKSIKPTLPNLNIENLKVLQIKWQT